MHTLKPVIPQFKLWSLEIIVYFVCLANKSTFIILLHLLLLFSVQAGKNPGNYLQQKFTAYNGLACTHTHCLHQDSLGFLWIGSTCGLARFDGKLFINYSTRHGLPSNLINFITEDCRKRIWVGTNKGLALYNGESFVTIPFPDNKDDLNIQGLLCRNDTLWIASREHIYQLSPSGSVQVMPDAPHGLTYSCLIKSGNGTIYAGCREGLFSLSPRVSKIAAVSGYVLSAISNAQNHIWVSSLNGRLYHLYPDGHCDSIITERDADINRLWYSRGSVWVTHSVHVSQLKGQELVPITGNIFNDNSGFISDIIEDQEANIWISSTKGLYKLQASLIRPVPSRGLDKPIVSSLISDKQRDILYVGGARNLYKLHHDSLIDLLPGKLPLISEIKVTALHPDGSIYIGEEIGGFYRIDKDLSVTKIGAEDRFISRRILSYTYGPDSSLYIGADNCFYHINRQHHIERYPVQGLTVTSLLWLDREFMLLGTDKGLFTWKRGAIHVCPDQPAVANPVFFLLKNTAQEILAASKGNGIYILRYSKHELRMIKSINTSNGLGSDFIMNLCEDDRGILWAAASNGLYRISNYRHSNPSFEYLNHENGLPDNTWNRTPMEIDRQGRLYIGGTGGLVSLDLEKMFSRKKAKLQVHVTGISSAVYADSTLAGGSKFWAHDFPGQSLDYKNNSVIIHYTGISLERPERILYQYLLEGLNQEWSSPTAERRAVFHQLPPGSYTFRVKAYRSDIEIPAAEASFQLIIKAPFWLSWWFKTLGVLTACAVLYSFYRWRLRLQISKEKAQLDIKRKLSESRFLAFQARMNPHFIFNSLNAIQYFITNNDRASTLNYLSRFARLLRQILDNSKESKITVEAEIQMLKSYLEMESLRFDSKFDYTLEVKPGLETGMVEIPGMVIQPFVENAIIHGLLHKQGQGQLRIILEKKTDQVLCIVEDDGIGRKNSLELNSKRGRNHKSHGMSIAISRLQLLNPDEDNLIPPIEINDLSHDPDNPGTKVIIRLPIL